MRVRLELQNQLQQHLAPCSFPWLRGSSQAFEGAIALGLVVSLLTMALCPAGGVLSRDLPGLILSFPGQEITLLW